MFKCFLIWVSFKDWNFSWLCRETQSHPSSFITAGHSTWAKWTEMGEWRRKTKVSNKQLCVLIYLLVILDNCRNRGKYQLALFKGVWLLLTSVRRPNPVRSSLSSGNVLHDVCSHCAGRWRCPAPPQSGQAGATRLSPPFELTRYCPV